MCWCHVLYVLSRIAKPFWNAFIHWPSMCFTDCFCKIWLYSCLGINPTTNPYPQVSTVRKIDLHVARLCLNGGLQSLLVSYKPTYTCCRWIALNAFPDVSCCGVFIFFFPASFDASAGIAYRDTTGYCLYFCWFRLFVSVQHCQHPSRTCCMKITFSYNLFETECIQHALYACNRHRMCRIWTASLR